MGIKEQIKSNILQELYAKIDDVYDLVHRRFDVNTENDKALIEALNDAKAALHLLAEKSELV